MKHSGGIAQLAEHELCKLGVTGSSPVASTSPPFVAGRHAGPREEATWAAFEGSLVGYGLAGHLNGVSGRVAQLVRACP